MKSLIELLTLFFAGEAKTSGLVYVWRDSKRAFADRSISFAQQIKIALESFDVSWIFPSTFYELE